MAESFTPTNPTEETDVVVRFSGDSGDGMQLAGNILSTVSATVGNSISTFPDFPADIRAPQGSLTGVSGFQVHIGSSEVFTPGDQCDVLVAMNAAALKTQLKYAKKGAAIIIDTEAFGPKDLEKAQFKTEDYLGELGVDPDQVVACNMTQMVKDCLTGDPAFTVDGKTDVKGIMKCRNMFALGLVCWLFDRDLDIVGNFLREKFAKKPAVAEANIKVVQAGYDFGHNTHSSVAHVRHIETKKKVPGRYMDITGNKATAYGFIAAAEKAGLKLYLGSYPITPATDVLHELSKHKSLGVTTVQCEDEIAGCRCFGRNLHFRPRHLPQERGDEPGRHHGTAARRARRAARRSRHRSAHEVGTDRPAAGPLRAQRREPHAGDGCHQSHRLLRRRLPGL